MIIFAAVRSVVTLADDVVGSHSVVSWDLIERRKGKMSLGDIDPYVHASFLVVKFSSRSSDLVQVRNHFIVVLNSWM